MVAVEKSHRCVDHSSVTFYLATCVCMGVMFDTFASGHLVLKWLVVAPSLSSLPIVIISFYFAIHDINLIQFNSVHLLAV